MIDWSFYDQLESFSIFDAGCLWIEIEPCAETESHVPPKVRMAMCLILTNLLDHPNYQAERINAQETIRRKDLIYAAEKSGVKPKFLYPSERTAEVLDPRKRDSYLVVIEAALSIAKVDPTDRDSTAKIVAATQQNGKSLSENTVRAILKEIKADTKPQ